MNREQLLEEMIVEKMIENKRLKEALTDCVTELSYLIDQTKSPIGGSVSKAFTKGQAALNAANNVLVSTELRLTRETRRGSPSPRARGWANIGTLHGHELRAATTVAEERSCTDQ